MVEASVAEESSASPGVYLSRKEGQVHYTDMTQLRGEVPDLYQCGCCDEEYSSFEDYTYHKYRKHNLKVVLVRSRRKPHIMVPTFFPLNKQTGDESQFVYTMNRNVKPGAVNQGSMQNCSFKSTVNVEDVNGSPTKLAKNGSSVHPVLPRDVRIHGLDEEDEDICGDEQVIVKTEDGDAITNDSCVALRSTIVDTDGNEYACSDDLSASNETTIETQPHEEELTESLLTELLQYGNDRKKVARRAVEVLFSEEERYSCNIKGVRGAGQLDLERMNLVRKATFHVCPAPAAEVGKLWRECCTSIDAARRNLKRIRKRKAAAQNGNEAIENDDTDMELLRD